MDEIVLSLNFFFLFMFLFLNPEASDTTPSQSFGSRQFPDFNKFHQIENTTLRTSHQKNEMILNAEIEYP